MNLLWSFVILVVANAIAIGAILFVRRTAPEGSYFTDGDRASGVFGVLATGFAIFAGFVIFLAFTSYDDSRSGAETEAITVVQQFETAQFFGSEARARLSGQIICYGRSNVYLEWPLMQKGADSDTINPWSAELFRTLKTVTPASDTQQSAYDKWVDLTSTREEARHDRIHGAAGIIPASLWIVLVLMAAIIFAYMLFFADSAEYKRSQAMLIGSGTTVVILTLLAINALDNPFRPGVGRIKPVAMERSLRTLDQAMKLTGENISLPCDARGTALPS